MSADWTSIIGFLDSLFILFLFEVSVTTDMDPLIAVGLIALHPQFIWDLLHADYAVLVVFEVFVAFHAEGVFLFDEIL